MHLVYLSSFSFNARTQTEIVQSEDSTKNKGMFTPQSFFFLYWQLPLIYMHDTIDINSVIPL